MIVRLWNGWTTPENAGAYERLLVSEVFPGIAAKNIPGCHGVELWRREVDGEVEFTTLMRFDDLDAVRAFVGEDYEAAYVPASARAILSRYDRRSRHFETRADEIMAKLEG